MPHVATNFGQCFDVYTIVQQVKVDKAKLCKLAEVGSKQFNEVLENMSTVSFY